MELINPNKGVLDEKTSIQTKKFEKFMSKFVKYRAF
jgi:hypothetical protein